ncbi:MAG TPA: response regulator [Pyrinomonadaceae bacterium]|nr:response regulator [Pyrinomonadaceae bacterium]
METRGKPTVLVVDDNADTRRVVRWMLERWGCDVVEASDGREAYEKTVEHRPRLVVMDLSMPIADGYEAIRSIRAREEFASLPVIAVTAFDRAVSRDGAEAAGFDYYLSKPIDFKRLEVLVEKLTRGVRPSSD